MSKTFRTWPEGRFPQLFSKYASFEVLEIVSVEDTAISIAPGRGTVEEVVLRWTWRERPKFDYQFHIRFDIPGRDNPTFPVTVGGRRVKRYAGEHVRGATSITLLVNRVNDDHHRTWTFTDTKGYFQFTRLMIASTSNGPVISGPYGTTAWMGTHYFLEEAPASEIELRLFASGVTDVGTNPIPLGSSGRRIEVYGDDPRFNDTPHPHTGEFNLRNSYYNRDEAPYLDYFLDFYVPPLGVSYAYYGGSMDLPMNHVQTMVFLYEEEVTLPLRAYDFAFAVPFDDAVTTDRPSNVSIGETATTNGLFADRVGQQR